MTLSDVFFVLQQSGCRLRVSSDGDITVDAPAGCPPVPLAVLEVLAKHRETLVAVLAPANPSEPAAGSNASSGSATPPGRRSPYARPNLALTATEVAQSTQQRGPMPPLDRDAILTSARAKLAAKAQVAVSALGGPPAGHAADAPQATAKGSEIEFFDLPF